MKSFLLFIFTLIVPLGIMAQILSSKDEGLLYKKSEQELIIQLLKSSDYYNDSIVKYNWDDNSSSYELEEKEMFSYNSNGQTTEYLKSIWNDSDIDLRPDDKETYYYNENSKLYEQYNFRWQTGLNDWIYETKKTLEYFNNGDSIVTENYIISDDLTEWIPSSKSIVSSTINNDSLIHLYMSFNWESESNSYIPNSKAISTYVNDLIIEELWQNWDDISSNYIPTSVTSYEYDFQNLNNKTKYRLIDGDTLKDWEMHYFYNANNLKEREEFTVFDINTQEVLNQIKTTFSYNEFSLTDTIINSRWDNIQENWLLITRSTLLYDDNNNLDIYEKSNYDQQQQDWEPSYKNIYYWSMLTGGLFEQNAIQLTVYPNPASNQIKIQSRQFNKVEQLNLISIDGKHRYKFGDINLEVNKVIDISRIPSGTYVLNGIIGDDRFSKLIMIE